MQGADLQVVGVWLACTTYASGQAGVAAILWAAVIVFMQWQPKCVLVRWLQLEFWPSSSAQERMLRVGTFVGSSGILVMVCTVVQGTQGDAGTLLYCCCCLGRWGRHKLFSLCDTCLL